MNPQFLVTKTHVPYLPPGCVPRPGLTRKLADALKHGIVLISAPAGYGKTTFLAGALGSCGKPAAWVTLEPGDDNPSAFWTYAASALASIAPEPMEPILDALRSLGPPPMEALLTALVNGLCRWSGELVLVLDDYQVIGSEAVHEGVTFLCEHLPPNLRLVIAGRSDPPLPLARWRARGTLSEVRTADLAFTIEETAAFWRTATGEALGAEELELLETRTEGWIAGLKMAALTPGRGGSGAVRAISGTSRHILDYFAEEVLPFQPPRIRDFLLETSILGRLCAPLADAVTGRNDGASVLGILESENLFISPLDDERRWYRYHQLFSDILRSRFTAADPGRVTMLHSRASAWFEAEGFMEEAADHALSSGDGDRAVRLLEQAAPGMLGRGQGAGLLRYAGRIPAPRLLSSPWLCLNFAWAALMTDDREQLLPMLTRAGQALEEPSGDLSPGSRENLGYLEGHLLSIRSFIARASGDTPLAVSLSEQADRILRGESAEVRLVAAVNAMNLAACYEESGDIAQAVPFIEDLIAAGRTGGFPYAVHTSEAHLAEICRQLSMTDRAERICSRLIARDPYRKDAFPAQGTAMALIVRGRLRYERNDLEGAASALHRGIELGASGGNREAVFRGNLYLADLALALGDPAASEKYLGQAEKAEAPDALSYGNPEAAAGRIRMDLRSGNIELARARVKDLERSLPLTPLPPYGREQPWLTLVRAKTAFGECTGLPDLLSAFIRNAERQSRTGAVIEGLIMKALALECLGEPEAALKSLDRALSLAEPCGYVRIFMDAGTPLFGLLRKTAGARGEYVSALLDAAAAESRRERGTGSGVSGETGSGSGLSMRELEVLRRAAAGSSNKEIAAELFLAEGTVKKHMNNIFEKLGVRSRTQAAARARDLGITG